MTDGLRSAFPAPSQNFTFAVPAAGTAGDSRFMLASDPAPTGAFVSDFWLRWLLPLLLIALSVLVVGTHYESNDDMLLTYIVSDYATIRHVPVLHQTYLFWIG